MNGKEESLLLRDGDGKGRENDGRERRKEGKGGGESFPTNKNRSRAVAKQAERRQIQKLFQFFYL